MLEIYTIYGGGMWKTALDAVVTLVGQNTFHTLMRIAGTFGVLAVLLTFIKQRNPIRSGYPVRELFMPTLQFVCRQTRNAALRSSSKPCCPSA